jgi:ribulose-phosphate 3-epimerase
LLSADFARLADHLGEVESAGAEVLHFDVMDGHFVDNISFGIPVLEKLRPVSKMFFDTHLMVTDPVKYAEPFARAGSDLLTFHIETTTEPLAVIEHIRSLGVNVGITMNPATPVKEIVPFIEQVDLVLIMSVWPGFGGQEFIRSSLDKLREIGRLLRPDQRLEVDGGIGPDTVSDAALAGADTFVAGSAIFDGSDPAAAMEQLQELAEQSM